MGSARTALRRVPGADDGHQPRRTPRWRGSTRRTPIRTCSRTVTWPRWPRTSESGDFGNLPDTQDQQRLAIIEWRVQLQLAAAQAGYPLPADIQQAGRGEIAPSPAGS